MQWSMSISILFEIANKIGYVLVWQKFSAPLDDLGISDDK